MVALRSCCFFSASLRSGGPAIATARRRSAPLPGGSSFARHGCDDGHARVRADSESSEP